MPNNTTIPRRKRCELLPSERETHFKLLLLSLLGFIKVLFPRLSLEAFKGLLARFLLDLVIPQK